MKALKLVVSTPDGNAYDEEALEISVRGSEGLLSIRAGHTPFITTTMEEKVRITTMDGEDLLAFASRGILTVTAEKTTLLCGKFKIEKQ